MSAQPRKRFSQNFLHDQNVINNIITAISPQKNDHVVEIGPGHGALTNKLASLVKRLDVVEIDTDLVQELKNANLPNLHIHAADALLFSVKDLGQNLRIVGNLPYNISTPLIFHFLSQTEHIKDMHFMLQKEVVERLAAPPNSKTYGRLSVMVQYYCQVEPLFTVSPNSFYPRPKVNSQVVRLLPRKFPVSAKDEKLFAKIVKLSFSKRRKTIANCLKGVITTQQLQELQINPHARAEQLTVTNFVKLTFAKLL